MPKEESPLPHCEHVQFNFIGLASFHPLSIDASLVLEVTGSGRFWCLFSRLETHSLEDRTYVTQPARYVEANDSAESLWKDSILSASPEP